MSGEIPTNDEWPVQALEQLVKCDGIAQMMMSSTRGASLARRILFLETQLAEAQALTETLREALKSLLPAKNIIMSWPHGGGKTTLTKAFSKLELPHGSSALLEEKAKAYKAGATRMLDFVGAAVVAVDKDGRLLRAAADLRDLENPYTWKRGEVV